MFALLNRVGGCGRMSRALAVVGIAAVLATSGQALAQRGGGRGHCGVGHGHSHSGSSFSISIGSGWGGYGSGYRSSYYSGWGGGCRPSYRPYCPPVYSYCPPPVVIAPCPPRVIYASPVYVERPVYVDRPVEVERVVERPVYVDRVVEKQVVVQKAVYVEPAPVPTQTVAAGYRDRELGDAYMRLADWNNAARVYGRYLGAWDKDGTAARNLGLAQISIGQPREGFANVVRGYQLEPQMMDRAIKLSDLGGPAGLQQIADAAVRSADSLNTPDAWFTVALVQSIAGQYDSALAALKKSRDAGLNKDLLDALTLKVSAMTQ